MERGGVTYLSFVFWPFSVHFSIISSSTLGFLIFVLPITNEVACLCADEDGGETWCWRPLHVEDFEALVDGMLAMHYQLSMVLGKRDCHCTSEIVVLLY
jgi:hypothetical protein